MKPQIEQLFIRIKREDRTFYNKDIKDSTSEQRMAFYKTLSKGQIMSLLEIYVKNQIAGEK